MQSSDRGERFGILLGALPIELLAFVAWFAVLRPGGGYHVLLLHPGEYAGVLPLSVLVGSAAALMFALPVIGVIDAGVALSRTPLPRVRVIARLMTIAAFLAGFVFNVFIAHDI